MRSKSIAGTAGIGGQRRRRRALRSTRVDREATRGSRLTRSTGRVRVAASDVSHREERVLRQATRRTQQRRGFPATVSRYAAILGRGSGRGRSSEQPRKARTHGRPVGKPPRHPIGCAPAPRTPVRATAGRGASQPGRRGRVDRGGPRPGSSLSQNRSEADPRPVRASRDGTHGPSVICRFAVFDLRFAIGGSPQRREGRGDESEVISVEGLCRWVLSGWIASLEPGSIGAPHWHVVWSHDPVSRPNAIDLITHPNRRPSTTARPNTHSPPPHRASQFLPLCDLPVSAVTFRIANRKSKLANPFCLIFSPPNDR